MHPKRRTRYVSLAQARKHSFAARKRDVTIPSFGLETAAACTLLTAEEIGQDARIASLAGRAVPKLLKGRVTHDSAGRAVVRKPRAARKCTEHLGVAAIAELRDDDALVRAHRQPATSHFAEQRKGQRKHHDPGAYLDARQVRSLEGKAVARTWVALSGHEFPPQLDLAGQTLKEANAGVPVGGAAKAPEKKKMHWFVRVLLYGALAFVALMILSVIWQKDAAFVVAGHAWKREIEVEKYGPVHDSEWCDRMPSGARNVTRSRAQRDTRKVADGEDCKTRKVDNGNGTFSEKRECTTKYRSEPIYDDKCSFTIDRWAKNRTEKAAGASLGEAPRWPDVKLSQTGQCMGCEREGTRSETYSVRLTDSSAKEEKTCDVDQTKWASFAAGSGWAGKVSMIGGMMDCGSLVKK